MHHPIKVFDSNRVAERFGYHWPLTCDNIKDILERLEGKIMTTHSTITQPLGTRLTYTHEGLTLPVYRFGTGQPILLLHGFPEDAVSWNHVVARLAAAGYQTWVPEMRGYAETAQPKGRAAYTVAHLLGDLNALITHFQLSTVHLVGHDWGGLLAWKLAQKWPQRITTLTVIATPHPQAMAWSFHHSTQLLHSAYIGGFQVPGLPEVIAHKGLKTFLRRSGLSQQATEYALARFKTPASLRGPINWYRGLTVPNQPHMKDHLIHMPTTYLWGRHDAFLGAAAAKITAEYVKADYRFIPVDAGHWIPENHPDVAAQAILDRITSANA